MIEEENKETESASETEVPAPEVVEETKAADKKKKTKKIVKNTISGVLLTIVGIAVILILISTFTANSNYGIPNLFGNQIMVVLTDSMDASEEGSYTPVYTTGDPVSHPAHALPTGCGIISQKVDTSSFEKTGIDPGDMVTFINSAGRIVTHRFIEYDSSTSQLVLMGDNLLAQTCPITGCSYPASADKVTVDRVLGVVSYASVALGTTLQVIQHPAFKACVIIVPLGVIFVWSIFDVIKAAKMKNEEEGVSDLFDEENGDKLPKNEIESDNKDNKEKEDDDDDWW